MEWIKIFGLLILFFLFEGVNCVFVILNALLFNAFGKEYFAAAERFFAVRAFRAENELARRLERAEEASDAPDTRKETKNDE